MSPHTAVRLYGKLITQDKVDLVLGPYRSPITDAVANVTEKHKIGYGTCQILVEAIRRAGSLNGEKVRDAISKMDHNTVHGRSRVDRDGIQIGHKMLLIQLQDGKPVIVWPEELAPDKPRFPTPPWNQRP